MIKHFIYISLLISSTISLSAQNETPPKTAILWHTAPDRSYPQECIETIAEEDFRQRDACSAQQVLNYMLKNFSNKKFHMVDGQTSLARLQFFIRKDGKIILPHLRVDPGCGIGKAILEAVESMIENGFQFAPSPSADPNKMSLYYIDIILKKDGTKINITGNKKID